MATEAASATAVAAFAAVLVAIAGEGLPLPLLLADIVADGISPFQRNICSTPFWKPRSLCLCRSKE